MRIFNIDKDKTIDKVEIYLTQEEAEDFEMRLTDLALHPVIADDSFWGDEKEEVNGIVSSYKEIYMILYPFKKDHDYSKRLIKVVKEDK